MNLKANGNGTRHYDVLVIGAGISGLACASRLLQNSHFKNPERLLVLEGRDRIGGRINAVTVNGHRLDTGANWIHGIGTKENPNPLLAILPHQRYKVLSGGVTFKVPENKDGKTKQGNRVVPSQIAGLLNAGVWETIEALHEMAKSMSAEEAKKTTILQGIIGSKPFKETYKNLPQEYHKTFGTMLQFVEAIEAGPLTEHSEERPEGKPGMSMLEYAINDYDGEQWFLQDGYSAIINEVAKDLLAQELVQLSTIVEQIDYSSSLITVYTNQGTFTADDVVCTIPLGVLKDRPSGLFNPELPQDKHDAIEKLGFGTLDKIFLVYDSPWWNEETFRSIMEKGIMEIPEEADAATFEPDTFGGTTNELPGIDIEADGTIAPGPQNLSIINLDSLVGIPVLSCFAACSTATNIESMSDEDVKGLVHRTITSWFGREPPKPKAVHVTRWARDPFSKGSYSHMIAGLSEAAHREVFKKPIVNADGARLRFAGEHTSRNHFAVAHGALTSGWREADSILAGVKKA